MTPDGCVDPLTIHEFFPSVGAASICDGFAADSTVEAELNPPVGQYSERPKLLTKLFQAVSKK